MVIERREGVPTKDEVAKCQGMFASSLRRISEVSYFNFHFICALI